MGQPRNAGSRRAVLIGMLLTGVLCAPASTGAAAVSSDAPPPVEHLVVTATRTATSLLDQAGNTGRVDQTTVERVRPTHAAELLHRVPGAWINRGSGQESLPAIRSPVLTGSGSCGAFLVAENGFPLRPTGFCNVNQLFEVNLEQADAVEVVRGPASSLYGSDAMHGLVNVLVAGPSTGQRLSLEAGEDAYRRGSLDLTGDSLRLLLSAVDDGGWRDRERYRQQKANLGYTVDHGADSLQLHVAATHLDQDTAGYVYGEDAFRDADLIRQNLNPGAFRQARAQRAGARWTRDLGNGQQVEGGLLLRHSDMHFLQHFLPGQPMEYNGQESLLGTWLWRRPLARGRLLLGADLELADGYLRQVQDGPLLEGSAFLRATRPAGRHYDYTVSSWMTAVFARMEQDLGERTRLGLGLRMENLSYDYDNRMLDGNTDEYGQACGFGGCLYTRPADRSDRFTRLAPKLELGHRIAPDRQVYVSARRGFRAPQATELYRLQSGQDVADLQPEVLDSLEAGFRQADRTHYLELAAFAMRKRNVIYRDSEGFNLSGARTRHRGVELDARLGPADGWRLELSATWARHRYASDHLEPRGEAIVSGRDVDTAPRTLASLRLGRELAGGTDIELEWQHTGAYYLDAGNGPRYPGHGLWQLRLRQPLGERLSLGLRVHNLADSAYAERADFAFGEYRYFPGRPRALFLDLSYAAPAR